MSVYIYIGYIYICTITFLEIIYLVHKFDFFYCLWMKIHAEKEMKWCKTYSIKYIFSKNFDFKTLTFNQQMQRAYSFNFDTVPCKKINTLLLFFTFSEATTINTSLCFIGNLCIRPTLKSKWWWSAKKRICFLVCVEKWNWGHQIIPLFSDTPK